MAKKRRRESVPEAVEDDKVEERMDEYVDLPIGKFLNGVRRNPWIIATFAIVIIFVLTFAFGIASFTGSAITGNTISVESAADNLISFVNAQGRGTATYVSGEVEGSLYRIIINFNGQDIPVYTTLDGRFLISNPVDLTAPLSGPGAGGAGGAGGGTVVDLEIGDAYFKGEVDAPVTIVEFTDYECPFCGRHFQQTMPLIIQNYVDTGKVKYVVMDFPLTSIHPEAVGAAEAARCVGEQAGNTGYFEMHDKLFGNQQLLSDASYKKWAREITGVNGVQFDTCLDSGKYTEDVLADQAYGQTLGVQGTPASFVNGQLVSGAVPYSQFEALIEAELAV